MNTEQIAAVAESILRPRLGLMGLDHVEVTAGYDHDGDPALFVTAYYQREPECRLVRCFRALTGRYTRRFKRKGKSASHI